MKFSENDRIFFTSDCHFGHRNISGKKLSKWSSGYRDFNSIEEMDETLLHNINKSVEYNDVLFILGDFAFNRPDYYRNRINCQNVYCTPGNHDKVDREFNNLFTYTSPYMEIIVGKQLFCLSHYSHRVWNKSHRGSIMLYGHSHNTLEDYGKSMDVGMDTCNHGHKKYHPYTLEEILGIMENKPIVNADRH